MDFNPSLDTPVPLFSDFSDDADMVELIELFVLELPERADQLNQAFESGDLHAIAIQAHQLKGAGGGYGFPTITEAAFQVEQHARAGNSDALAQPLGQLVALCRRAQATG